MEENIGSESREGLPGGKIRVGTDIEGGVDRMWQSLSFKPGYKAAYCLSVCPAGSDVLGPYMEDKVEYRKRILDPLLAKPETVYVLKASHFSGALKSTSSFELRTRSVALSGP